MRFFRAMFLLALAVGMTGCFTLGRGRNGPTGNAATKSNGTATGNSAPANQINRAPFWARESESANQTNPNLAIPNHSKASGTTGAVVTDYNGVLAGTLVDSFNRPVPRAFLQIVAVDGSIRPIEMTVENGWFTVPGLTPGRSYMLTARVADGERKLAGRVQVTAPNPRVVIRLSEDLYSGTVPPPPVVDDFGVGTSAPGSGRAGAGAEDGWKLPERSPAGPGPLGIDPPSPPLPAANGPLLEEQYPAPNMENITGREPRRDQNGFPPAPPLINLPNQPTPPLPETGPPLPPRGNSGVNRLPATSLIATPRCEFAGPHRLKNLVLPDVYGTPWEFQEAQGQLILLDFWGTWCRPCLAAIPHIKRLHSEYGPAGLEVVGIACERGNESQRSRQALEAIERHKVNYRVLIAEEFDRCPVQQRFGIQSYPTLILLDRQGNIRWRGDANGLVQLEAILRRDLRGSR